MDEPILTLDERAAIKSGRWFSSLSASLRHDILRCAYVKRYREGDLITARGDPAGEWIACATGAVRVSSTSLSGKQVTLTYVEPGIWFGDVAIFDGERPGGRPQHAALAGAPGQAVAASGSQLRCAEPERKTRRGADRSATRAGGTGAIAGRLAPAGEPGTQMHGARRSNSHRAGRPGGAKPGHADAYFEADVDK